MTDTSLPTPASVSVERPLLGELERLTRENAMLRLAVQEMPHGLSVFDGDDKLVFANRHLAKVWGLPDGLLQPGTSLAPAFSVSSPAQPVQKPSKVACNPPLSQAAWACAGANG